ncbi:hypothetical protein [Burkholderia ubonensis]|uniref:hypothetical protein n=1 Tax=Burkholderia ubonensis TaxID=101571 RepID=UPI001161294A|nr:hypothetical protein [Burkholderia ubonensis]
MPRQLLSDLVRIWQDIFASRRHRLFFDELLIALGDSALILKHYLFSQKPRRIMKRNGIAVMLLASGLCLAGISKAAQIGINPIVDTPDFQIASTDVDSSTSDGRNCVFFPFQPTRADVTAITTDVNDGREHVVPVPAANLIGKTIFWDSRKTEYFIQRTEQKVCIQYASNSDVTRAQAAGPTTVVGPNNSNWVKYVVKAYKALPGEAQ